MRCSHSPGLEGAAEGNANSLYCVPTPYLHLYFYPKAHKQQLVSSSSSSSSSTENTRHRPVQQKIKALSSCRVLEALPPCDLQRSKSLTRTRSSYGDSESRELYRRRCRLASLRGLSKCAIRRFKTKKLEKRDRNWTVTSGTELHVLSYRKPRVLCTHVLRLRIVRTCVVWLDYARRMYSPKARGGVSVCRFVSVSISWVVTMVQYRGLNGGNGGATSCCGRLSICLSCKRCADSAPIFVNSPFFSAT